MILDGKIAIVLGVLLLIAGALIGVISITLMVQPFFDKAETAIISCVEQLDQCKLGFDPENVAINPIE